MATILRCGNCKAQFGDPGGPLDGYYCAACGSTPLFRLQLPASTAGPTIAGGVAGAAFGGMVGGPIGLLIGAILGGIVGNKAGK